MSEERVDPPSDDGLPMTERQFVVWMWRGAAALVVVFVLAWGTLIWNARETVRAQTFEIHQLQVDVEALRRDRSHEEAMMQMKVDLQQQLDRRFRAVEDSQARIMSRLDEHMTQSGKGRS